MSRSHQIAQDDHTDEEGSRINDDDNTNEIVDQDDDSFDE